MCTLLIPFKLVYVWFGYNHMHSTFDFCPRPARKKQNVPLHERSKRLLAWYIYCAKKHFISLSTFSNFFEKNIQKKLSMICWVFANLSQNLFHLTKLWVYQIKPIKLAFSGLKWMFFCFKTIILKTCFLNPLQTSDFDYWNKEQ